MVFTLKELIGVIIGFIGAVIMITSPGCDGCYEPQLSIGVVLFVLGAVIGLWDSILNE